MTFDEITTIDLLNYFKRFHKDEKFDITQYGELCIVKDGELTPIANFTLIPMEIINRVAKDGTITPYKYTFTGILFDGDSPTKLHRIEVLHENLRKRKWLNEQNPLGYFYLKETSGFNYVLQFILKSLKETTQHIEYDNTGWNKYDGDWIYVHSNGVIGTDKRISSTNKEAYLHVDKELSAKEAFNESLKMLDICDRKLTHSLLSLTLTSIVTTPLMKHGLSPKFSMWIYGKTGLGKTTISKLFTQIFEGNRIVHVYDYKKDIKKLAMSRDCVSIFDDYGTAKTKSTEYRMDEIVEEIIRWAGDREPSSNFSVRPEGMALFTGESFLSLNTRNESSIARVVRVEMDNLFNKTAKNYDAKKVEKFKQYSSKRYLSTSIGYYLKWLSKKLNSKFLENYSHDFNKIKNEVKDLAHERHIDSITHLMVSFNFYLSYGREEEFITPEQFSNYSASAKEIFFELLRDQNYPTIDQDVDIFLKTLEKLIVEEKITVIVKGIPYPMNITPHGIVDLEQKTLSLTWQTVYDMVINEILATNVEMSDFVSDKKLGKLLRDYKLIYRQGDERNTKPVSGLNGRAIQFKTDMITKLVDVIIEINKNSSFNMLLSQYAKVNESEIEYGPLSKKRQKKLREEIGTIFDNML